MLEIAAITLATLFATVSPIDISAIFAALTSEYSDQKRKKTAIRSVVVATIVLLVFAVLGEALLSVLGISMASLRTAGGIILLLIGIEMVFARTSGASSTTELEDEETQERQDVSVFPMALPLIAGPGSMGAVMLMMAHASDFYQQATVILCVIAIMLLTLVCLFAATPITRLLGVTGMHVIMRVMGVLLCALAVQFIFDGVVESGVLTAVGQ